MIRHDVRSPERSETSEFTASVLIIEDDTHVRSLYGRQLSCPPGTAGEVPNAETIPAASGRPRGYAAVLLDVDIPDVVRAALPEAAAAAGGDGPLVVMNGRLTVRITVEAPAPSDLLPPPARIHAQSRPRILEEHPHSTAHRWACYVLSVCDAPHDIRTLHDWAKHVGTSHTTLRQICRMLGVRPHDARNLGRALFAIIHAGRERCPPTVLLDVADTRTLRVFLRKAGPEFRSAHDMSSIHRFLDSQGFVDRHNQGLRILRELLHAHLTGHAA